MAPRGPPRVRRLCEELAATYAIRKGCVRYRGLNRSGGGDWRGNSPRPSGVMRGMGGRTAAPSNRCGTQGGCEPATASSRSPGGSLRERRAASDRRLWEAVVCRGAMRCLRVTRLTGRHGTSCHGDGSGLLLECRKARGPLRSKRWLASAAVSENTWTRDPGARRADASSLSGVGRDLVYAPAPCGWVETVYDAPPVRPHAKSVQRSLRERKTCFIGAAPQNVLDARDLAVTRQACLEVRSLPQEGFPSGPARLQQTLRHRKGATRDFVPPGCEVSPAFEWCVHARDAAMPSPEGAGRVAESVVEPRRQRIGCSDLSVIAMYTTTEGGRPSHA